MLETPKALDTIRFKIFKILLVKILKDATMDNQQETNEIIITKTQNNQKQPKTTKTNQKQPKQTKNNQKQPKTTKNNQNIQRNLELHKILKYII